MALIIYRYTAVSPSLEEIQM